MKKFLPLICFLTFLLTNDIMAQIPPCLPSDGGEPAGDGPPGCNLCGPIYAGSTQPYSPGPPGDAGFPCGTIENNQFIQIIAGASGTLEATILATNCQNGQGVQLIIFDQSFNPVSNCFSSGGVNLPGNVSAGGLTPGQIYWIMIDGFAGDICDILITVTGGADTGPPDAPGPITANPDCPNLCPGAVICYSIDPVGGASEYEWLVPGNATVLSGGGPLDTEVCVRYDSPGGGVVRVTPSNPCFPGFPSIAPVVVTPVIVPPKAPEFYCLNEFPVIIDGNAFNGPGTYPITYKTKKLQCDSVVTYILLPKVQVPAVVQDTLCIGECFQVGFDCVTTSGRYELTGPFAQENGCDSVVIVSLTYIDPQAMIVPPPPIDCGSGSTVTLNGGASSSGAGITYSWSAYGGGVLSGNTMGSSATGTAPGFYVLTVTQGNPNGSNCIVRDTVEVIQNVSTIDQPVFTNAETNICAGETGTYTISPVSGAINYTWTVPNGATFTGSGTSITIDFGSAVAGTVCVTATGDCGDSPPTCLPITINPVPTADFTATSPICITDASTIQYTGTGTPFASFDWNFNGGDPATVSGGGPHTIMWNSPGPKTVTLTVTENGCESQVGTQTVVVESELPEPVISCTSTQTSVTFTWNAVPGATNYNVTIDGVAQGSQGGTTFTVNGLAPGASVDITVEAVGATACGNSMASSDCVAQDCPDVTITIPPITDICRDPNTGAVSLSATQVGGDGSGTFTWSGNGVTGTSFNPQAGNVGINTVVVEYVEGTCTYTKSTEITVNDVPDPSFSVVSPICEDEVSTVTYTGSASSSAMFDWDFGSGNNVNGAAGVGPYDIQFPSGNQTVSLTVTENGCVSPMSSQPIQVDAPLPDPVINCGTSTTTSTMFTWGAVPGATSYQILPDPNTTPGFSADMAARTLTVTGLTTGERVTITVIAEGNTECGPSQASFTCEASNCPPEPVTVDAIGPFCDDGTGTLATLNASAGDNSGIFTWTGPGVTGNQFDPNAPSINPGTITISVTYTKDNCTYNGSTDVEIRPQPTSGFTVVSPICNDETSTITYTGNADPTATYNWNFDGGNAASGSGVGPYEISYGTGSAPTVSLTVEQGGCISAETTMPITVDDPMTNPIITCDSDQSSITFNWAPVAGALTYDVTLDNSPGGGTSDTDNLSFFTQSGLGTNDEVTITVTAQNDNNACGPTSTTLTCVAKDCPNYNVVMPVIAPICMNGGQVGFDLDTIIEVTNQIGDNLIDSVSLRWHDGNDANDYVTFGGQFFPNSAVDVFGTGDVPIAVEIEFPLNSGCFKTYTSTIRLNPQPDNVVLITTPICITDQATVQIQNQPRDPDATFDWFFGNADDIQGADGGPYTLGFPASSAGTTEDVTLVVTEFGCASNPIMASVDISAETPAPVFGCDIDNTGNTMITMNWDVNPNTDYQVDVITAGFTPTNVDNVNGVVFFDGLTPGDEITVEVTATVSGSACPPMTTPVTCTAKQCPQTEIEIPIPSDLCLNASGGTTIQMERNITNSPSNGSAGIGTWGGGSYITASGVFTPTEQRSYTITYDYTEDGCSYSETITFDMFETPTADFTVVDRICELDGSLVEYLGDAHPDAVFTWDYDGGVTAPGATDREPGEVTWTNNPGSKNITLSIDNNGCTAAPMDMNVQVDPDLDPLEIECGDATTTTVEFFWNSDSNVDDYEISISRAGTPFFSQGTQTNTTFELIGAGVTGPRAVTIQVISNTNSLCGGDTIQRICNLLNCPDFDIVLIQPEPFCIDDEPGVVLGFDQSGLGVNGTYTYSGTGVNSDGVFDPALAGEGTHTITLDYDEDGCTASGTVDVVVVGLPDVDAGEDKSVSCVIDDVELGSSSNSGSLDFTWLFNGNVVGNTQFLTVDEAGDYTLEVVDANGCMNSDDVFVDGSFSQPDIDAQINEITCFGRNDGSITINGMDGGSPPFEYSFNGGAFSSSNTFFSNLGPGDYTIVGRDANGCEDDITFTIIEPDDITVELVIQSGENPVPFGDSILIEAVTNYAPDLLSSVTWTPSEQFPICDETNITNCLSFWVTPTGQTVYTVRIENLNGCAADDVINVVGIKDHPVFIPSAFSPRDQDGTNDIFGIFGESDIISNVKTFLVFDRWGELVYENYDIPSSTGTGIEPQYGWNGTHRGKAMNSGVYVYMFEVEFFDGTVEIFKGDVTIR